ncbi:MAG: M3 family oligoendopeptidase [Clostridia bacterium]|nr:M3 family oligoendopeptidase [Clostridia bacterium]
MTNEWDLTILYSGFDDPAIEADLASLDDAIAAKNALAADAESRTHSELLASYISLSETIGELSSKLYEYASLRYSTNTADPDAANMTGKLMEKFSATAAADAKLERMIASFDDLEDLISDGFGEYAYLLRSLKKNSRYLLADGEEALLSKMKISGSSAWEDLQASLTSGVKADYRGERIPLSAVRNLAYDPDPSVRRDAYEAELACYAPIREAVAFSLNSIKLQMLNECALRGYESPLDKALKDSRMKRETLDALIGAMEEYLPVFWKYLRAKAKALGHENGLPWYDLFAPMGKSDRKFTIPEAKETLISFFEPFDGELAELIRRAFDENWIDFLPRAGKVGGAFCAGIPSAKQSRVLTNFDGSFSDVITLAHELGHAFHGSRVFENSILNQDYGMPVAETASTFNEVVAGGASVAMAQSDEEKLNLLEGQISDACQIICDIYSRYLFETAVFENRPEEFMSADRLSELMTEAQKKAYGDGLDQSCLHPYMWVCKSHYYSGDLSFYNFPYAFGGLFARGLYAKYRAEGESFVPLYKELLRATTVNDVEDTAKIAGIDLTDRAFWEAGLCSIAEQIETFCTMVE